MVGDVRRRPTATGPPARTRPPSVATAAVPAPPVRLVAPVVGAGTLPFFAAHVSVGVPPPGAGSPVTTTLPAPSATAPMAVVNVAADTLNASADVVAVPRHRERAAGGVDRDRLDLGGRDDRVGDARHLHGLPHGP